MVHNLTVLRRFRRSAGLCAVVLALLPCGPALAQPAVSSPAEQLAALDTAALPPATRAAIADSRAAWQQLGPLPGGRWLLVNIPAFEISLMDGSRKLAVWRAIVGKAKTPTPRFSGEATAVILNPWWDVPASIVAESVGPMLARRPKEAARKGYVRQGDRYRQAPGPDNQLGQMKLEFRNIYSIGIHDTPSRQLFARGSRALSHGCIRVDDAMGFAATLLGAPTSRDSLATVAATNRETQRLALAEPIPVIVGYFTAEVGDDGRLRLFDDVYRRVRPPAADAGSDCGL